ncbi:MAG: ABC transporter ATP-binding protein [Proteobacteria bacterium]|jgi:lipoprotein-releasing system ATP-binding protein|nr:ABC transporter ATP-binding protein [Alphaproteobacteria bacterium]NCC03927.1 ABC transporter ATP-binding protein [Pseudomonadota bacterium]
MSEMALHLQGIVRTFHQAGETLDVLRGCDMHVMRGERVALIGPSGAGKSTLLHIAGLLEKPDKGVILIDDKRADGLDDTQRTLLRRSTIGFVYQSHHLLPEFSARENIVLPQMIAGKTETEAKKRADELLELIRLDRRATHRPAQLSGGEQQRIAIARALANKPTILIADEPTGNLDPHTAGDVFNILKEIVDDQKVGILMATHNLELAHRMDRQYSLEDGLILERKDA